MKTEKIIDINNENVPQEAIDAFSWNQKLTKSEYQAPLQGELREDGSVAAFISSDSKSILFYDDCAKNGKTGRIINDEVAFHPFGPDFVLVEAKAYIYIDDVLKGSAVAGQMFQVGSPDMDRVVQFASGLAKTRALSNAGYGVVSTVSIPGTPNTPGPDISGFQGNPGMEYPPPLPPVPQPAPAPGTMPGGFQGVYPNVPTSTGTIAAPAPTSVSGNPAANDPTAWAKAVIWPAKRKSLGELLATEPTNIRWIAENMRQDNDVKRAALVLYPEACRKLGVAPKQM